MVAIGLVKGRINKLKNTEKKRRLEAASSESSISDGDESLDHGMLGSSKSL